MARSPEPVRTHLQLNSQSYTTFLEMHQAINQYLKARKGFKVMERDDPMDVDFVHKERKRQGQRKAHRQEANRIKKKSRVPAGTGARQDTRGANVGRQAVEPRNKRTMSVRRRKLAGDVNWIMMVQDLSVGQSSTSEIETWRCSGTSVSCKSAQESQVSIHAESHRVVPNPNVALHPNLRII